MSLTYKQYKALSPDLKEEYNWRFKDMGSLPNFSGAVISLLAFIAIIVSMGALAATNSPSDATMLYFKITGLVASLGVAIWWTFVFTICANVVTWIVEFYAYRKWKKENNI